jgi:hypothetical protein
MIGRLGSWFRGLRWYWRLPVGAAALFLASILLYVGIRTLQYAAGDKDPSLYVPAGSQMVLRLSRLESEGARIQGTVAWRVVERKVLRDPALRRALNGLLKSSGAPTLDDLEDRRKSGVAEFRRAFEVLGLDAVGVAQAGEAPGSWRGGAIVKLRWWQHLLTPFAGLLLPSETEGGRKLLRLPLGKQPVYLAFAGVLVLASNDKAFLEQGLRRTGSTLPGDAFVRGRIRFDGSPRMTEIRDALVGSGAFPYIDAADLEGLSFSLGVEGGTLRAEALMEKARPLLGTPVPWRFRAWAPESCTGLFATNTGGRDLVDRLRKLGLAGGPRDVGLRNLRQALELLDDAGLESAFLPKTEPGLLLMTGMEVRDGRVYPAFAMVLPSGDPKGAVEAMNALVRKRAGAWAEKSNRVERPVGDTMLHSWRWPDALEINDFLRPTYAAVGDAFVLGNNEGFTEQLIRTAGQGGGLEAGPAYRRLLQRLKEEGFTGEAGLAGGFLLPPQIRESLDGLLIHAARQRVYAELDPAKLRAEVVEELTARLRQPPPEADVVNAYNEAIERRKADREEGFRTDLRALDFAKWAAFEAEPLPGGVRLRGAVELR